MILIRSHSRGSKARYWSLTIRISRSHSAQMLNRMSKNPSIVDLTSEMEVGADVRNDALKGEGLPHGGLSR